MDIDFTDLAYLQHGSPTQRQVFDLLRDHAVFDKLSGFDPVLAGTFPIDIAIAGSDLDILCFWTDADIFIQTLQSAFSNEAGFALREITLNGDPTVIANFSIGAHLLEIFGQNVPVKQQNAFRHLLVEHAILEAKGAGFRDEIIRLKQNGLKTEPAFALLLRLDGDPYAALLELSTGDLKLPQKN